MIEQVADQDEVTDISAESVPVSTDTVQEQSSDQAPSSNETVQESSSSSLQKLLSLRPTESEGQAVVSNPDKAQMMQLFSQALEEGATQKEVLAQINALPPEEQKQFLPILESVHQELSSVREITENGVVESMDDEGNIVVDTGTEKRAIPGYLVVGALMFDIAFNGGHGFIRQFFQKAFDDTSGSFLKRLGFDLPKNGGLGAVGEKIVNKLDKRDLLDMVQKSQPEDVDQLLSIFNQKQRQDMLSGQLFGNGFWRKKLSDQEIGLIFQKLLNKDVSQDLSNTDIQRLKKLNLHDTYTAFKSKQNQQ